MPAEILSDQQVSTVSDPRSGMRSDYFHNGWVHQRFQCRFGGQADSEALPLLCDPTECRGCTGAERWGAGGCAGEEGIFIKIIQKNISFFVLLKEFYQNLYFLTSKHLFFQAG